VVVLVVVIVVDILEFVGAIDVVLRLTLSVLNEVLALNGCFNMVVPKLGRGPDGDISYGDKSCVFFQISKSEPLFKGEN